MSAEGLKHKLKVLTTKVPTTELFSTF